MPNFPERPPSPVRSGRKPRGILSSVRDALRGIRIIYIAACAFLARINVFRRSLVRYAARRDEDRYKSTARRFPSVRPSLWPRGINNTSRDLHGIHPPPRLFLSLLPPLIAARTPRRRDRVTNVHPSRGDGSWWIRGIRWEQKDVGFSVEGVFVVLMRYNGMDPGCWCIVRSGVPRIPWPGPRSTRPP